MYTNGNSNRPKGSSLFNRRPRGSLHLFITVFLLICLVYVLYLNNLHQIRIEDIKTKASLAESKYLSVSKKIKGLQQDNRELIISMDKEKDERERLHVELVDQQESSKDLKVCNMQLQETLTRKTELESQLANLNSELAETLAQKDAVNVERDREAKVFESHENEVKKLREEKENLQRQIKSQAKLPGQAANVHGLDKMQNELMKCLSFQTVVRKLGWNSILSESLKTLGSSEINILKDVLGQSSGNTQKHTVAVDSRAASEVIPNATPKSAASVRPNAANHDKLNTPQQFHPETQKALSQLSSQNFTREAKPLEADSRKDALQKLQKIKNAQDEMMVDSAKKIEKLMEIQNPSLNDSTLNKAKKQIENVLAKYERDDHDEKETVQENRTEDEDELVVENSKKTNKNRDMLERKSFPDPKNQTDKPQLEEKLDYRRKPVRDGSQLPVPRHLPKTPTVLQTPNRSDSQVSPKSDEESDLRIDVEEVLEDQDEMKPLSRDRGREFHAEDVVDADAENLDDNSNRNNKIGNFNKSAVIV